jgi:hypothetical protein
MSRLPLDTVESDRLHRFIRTLLGTAEELSGSGYGLLVR